MPVFNSYIATRKTSRRQKDSSSAGAAKVPRVGVNKSDLEAQGIQNGWTAGPVTHKQVREMSSSELHWHEIYNATNLEKAIALPGIAKERKNIDRQWAVRRMWEGKATPDENEKCRIAGDTFATRTPQFARTMENAMLMIEHMQQNDLDATEVSAYITAYRELTNQGKLMVAPAQSADQYRAAHPELKDDRVPPLIAARTARKEATEKFFEQAKEATAHAGTTSFTDYPADETGYPNYPSKYSFRRLLDSLDADSYARRLKDDPQFAAAINKLK